MSEPLLNVMKVMLLAGLYLFFVRVLWSVFNELRDPRTVARKRSERGRGRDSGNDGKVRPAPGERFGDTTGRGAPAPSPAVHAPQRGGAAVAVAAGQLVVLEPPELAGMAYALGPEITLGRAPTNGITLDDTYVSTVHARIFLTNGMYFVEDLASRNGSTLNGQPLVATAPLMPGDRLQLGATMMEFA